MLRGKKRIDRKGGHTEGKEREGWEKGVELDCGKEIGVRVDATRMDATRKEEQRNGSEGWT